MIKNGQQKKKTIVDKNKVMSYRPKGAVCQKEKSRKMVDGNVVMSYRPKGAACRKKKEKRSAEM